MQHSFEQLDRPGGFARVGLLRPLRHRDFRLLWAGMSVSLVGDGVFLVATAWTAYSLWDAPAALSVVGIAMSVPTIACLLVGGAVSDRYDRRRVMLLADVARGLAIALLAALAFAHQLTFAVLVAVVALYAIGAGFFTPAFEAAVPGLVPADDLPQANALDQFVRPIAMRLVGPSLGGVVVGLGGAGTAFAIDAASFGVSALAVAALAPLHGEGDASHTTISAVRDGLRFVRRRAWLWGTLVSAAAAYLLFLGPTEVLLPYVVKNDLHASAFDLGIVLAAGGVGAVGAAAVMGERDHPRRSMTFIYACWTLATLAVVGYGLGRSVPQLMLACLLFNALEAAGTIVWATVKQRHVPASLLGRVSSLDWLISISLLPVSYALTGPAAAAIGARATLAAAGVAGAVVTAAALFLPGMRDVEDPPPVRAAPVAEHP
ncbi:MAG TPA: MFS transporter [Gaiellaceae bacterium]|jgi:DHA3 family tetracycline resistance protein-like MFS transporter